MSTSCSGLLDQLVRCVANSECVSRQGRSIKDCIQDAKGVPESCASVHATYVQCKKNQVDMRTRIRGNKGY